MELRCHARQDKKERPQPQNSKDIGSEDDEGFARDGKDRRDAVDREDDVGDLDEDQRDQQRCSPPPSGFPHKEFVTAEAGGDRQDHLEQADDKVSGWIRGGLRTEGHLDSGKTEKDAENKRNP